jgi:hypothetical protein
MIASSKAGLDAQVPQLGEQLFFLLSFLFLSHLSLESFLRIIAEPYNSKRLHRIVTRITP